MQPKKSIESNPPIEAIVGVLENGQEASRVAASLRSPELKMQRVSATNPAATDQLPQLVYDDIERVGGDDVGQGMLKGGAIGAGSGLLFLGVPGLNVAAPIAGMLAGAWIGGIAGIDEANRGKRLPNEEDYRRMLADGKSFIVIAAEEPERIELEKRMFELGVKEIHQHPPIGQLVRDPANQ